MSRTGTVDIILPRQVAVLAAGGDFAVAVPWTDSGQARLVTLALRDGLEARTTDEAFVKDGRTYPRGTVIFPTAANSPEAMARLSVLANEIGAETVAMADSWVEDGPIRETYLVEPGSVQSLDELITEVQIPVGYGR